MIKTNISQSDNLPWIHQIIACLQCFILQCQSNFGQFHYGMLKSEVCCTEEVGGPEILHILM